MVIGQGQWIQQQRTTSQAATGNPDSQKPTNKMWFKAQKKTIQNSFVAL
jgi:hypothetical protein